MGVPYPFNTTHYNECYNLLQTASEQKCGFVLTMHELVDENPQEDYQITVNKFKKFLDKAMDYVNNGTLEFITLDKLYARYYPNNAKKLEKRRTLKMIDYMEKEHEAVEEEISNFKTAILSSTDFDDLESKFQIG